MIDLNNKKYKWTMKASFAPSDFTNPGIRSGGQTEIGKMFGRRWTAPQILKVVFFIEPVEGVLVIWFIQSE